MSEFVTVTVTVRQGVLRGRRREKPEGDAFLSFQGVPYAKPPIGALRFKAPHPAEPWTGIRDATQEGNACLHIDTVIKQMVGDEDCLFLNVFTRRLPTGGRDKSRAVLVWIHGGGFAEGSGNGWGPDLFMAYDVVLVTLTYRLGPLGFLSMGTKELPGNAGLKDQTMALRWIQDNIAAFGGDPDNVTLFGESAGAVCAHLHWMSPLSRGLFRRVICQSGSALCWWSTSRDSVGRAKRLALAAGCDAAILDDPDELFKWLQEAPPQALVRAVKAARTKEEKLGFVTFIFLPVVEPNQPGAFLTKDPHEIMAERLTDGRADHTPLVLGVMSHEGILRLPGVPTPKAWEQTDAHFEYTLPYDVLADRRNTARTQEVCQRIKDFYMGGKLSEETAEGYVHYSTDMMFAHSLTLTARAHARLGAPVYMFVFEFVGRLNMFGPLYGSRRVAGACHADELAYLFHIDKLPPVEDDSSEALVRRRMVRMWVDFAQGGNPTSVVNEDITVKWKKFSEAEPYYLKISDELILNTGIFKERMEFWDNLYKSEGTRRHYFDNQIDLNKSQNRHSNL